MGRTVAVASATTVALALLILPRSGRAEEWPGGHLGYGIGGSYVNGSQFRETLDIGVDYLHGVQCKARDPISSCQGVMLSASLVSGFGRSPTYLTLDGGYGFVGAFGGHLLAGPAVRLGSQPGFGFDVQAVAYFFFFELGPRLLVIPSGSNEVQITLMLGLGFN